MPSAALAGTKKSRAPKSAFSLSVLKITAGTRKANVQNYGICTTQKTQNRPNQDFRGFAGTISEGSIQNGDEIRVAATGQTAKIDRIVTFDGDLTRAQRGQAVTLTLDREIDISRGDVLSLAQQPLETTDSFEATVVWLSEEAGLPGRTYDLKLASQWSSASITSISR